MVKILAASGGVDSMALFDMMWRKCATEDKVVVAHFNHGTRKSAEDDQKFVQRICEEREVNFETMRVGLGEGTSEELARKKRYEFLSEVAKKYGDNAEIYVAHHVDDLVESVAINCLRGTGWRGLTPMQNPMIQRPFLEMGWGKAEILHYAAENNVSFRADPTNTSDAYLRNRIREVLQTLNVDERKKIYHNVICLYRKQCDLRAEIEKVIHDMIYSVQQYPRKWFDKSDDIVQLELLRAILEKAGVQTTQPQRIRFLRAIREYDPGKSFNLPGDRLVKIQKTYFVI